MLTRAIATLAVLAAAASTAGCDGLGIGAERTPAATLTLAVPTPSTGARASLVPVTDGTGRTIDVQRVQLLLRSAQLKRVEDSDCAEEDDACEKFTTGYALVDLPPAGGTVTAFTTPIRPGTYDALRIRIKEPEDDNGARARFRAENPDWPRKATVRVRGTFDAGGGAGARPFDVFIEADADVRRTLSPPLVIDAETDPSAANVTLSVAVAEWFRTRSGSLIDPARLASDRTLAREVEENVESSLEAFRDEDRDGRDESDDDGTSEAEGRVASVSTSAGTFRLAGGRTVELTQSTTIATDGDLLSLQAVADAVAAGRVVEAEAKGALVMRGGSQVLVAGWVKFETD